MNTEKETKVENEQKASQDDKLQTEHLQANIQRLLREQSDMAHITPFSQRDE